MEFKQWFCLKGRDSFTIDPKVNPHDARFYFGRHEKLKSITAQLRRAFVDPGIPKMVIFGSYGSGKTQTLYHIKHLLESEKPMACKGDLLIFHLDLEMHSKSDSSDWHIQIMETLGRDLVSQWVDALFGKVQNLDDELVTVFQDKNSAEAAKNLRVGGETAHLAWRWLSGNKLTASELERLRVTRNLGDVGTGDMVNSLVGVARLAERNGKTLIMLMDEGEHFTRVKTGDQSESLHTYLRKLSEPWNSSLGFILAAYALTRDDMAEIIVRDDIRTRIGENNFIDLPPLPTVKDVEIFLRELIVELVSQEKAEKKIQDESLGVSVQTYPFTADAFDRLCEYASQDPVKALPRNIIKAVNECAISAWDEKKRIVEPRIVDEIALIIFG